VGVTRSTRARLRSADLPTTRGAVVRLSPLLDTSSQRDWEARVVDSRSIIVLDLFCGAGGLSLGFQDEGFFVAAGIDSDARAVETHAANFLARSCTRDLRGITADGVHWLVQDELGLPRVDVIVGGPPCQGFAGVGQAKIRSLDHVTRARLQKRNHLYREFVAFVSALQPLCFVMENVPHLRSYEGGHIFDMIRYDFDRIGYDIGTSDKPGEPLVLNAEEFGAPQTRRRLFFLGYRRGATAAIAAPRTTNMGLVPSRIRVESQPVQLALGGTDARERLASYFLPLPRTLADAIADLPSLHPPALEHVREYQRVRRPDLISDRALRDHDTYLELMHGGMPAGSEQLIFDHVVRPVREDDAEAFKFIPPGGTYEDVPSDYRRYKLRRDHFEDRYFRLPWGQPSRAITAHIAKDGYWYIHPDVDQGRTLSVREAARVQTFPDHFRFAGHRTSMYRQIGNAVPPLLARAIARRIREAIERRVSFEKANGFRVTGVDQLSAQACLPAEPARGHLQAPHL
jgi:DNA (cytosine-5)-methyltransferase 1